MVNPPVREISVEEIDDLEDTLSRVVYHQVVGGESLFEVAQGLANKINALAAAGYVATATPGLSIALSGTPALAEEQNRQDRVHGEEHDHEALEEIVVRATALDRDLVEVSGLEPVDGGGRDNVAVLVRAVEHGLALDRGHQHVLVLGQDLRPPVGLPGIGHKGRRRL